ncbi:leucine-responsive transcriptional regulator LEU3 [Lachancea thermotolerans CBS 6340]|uniref:KLTH0F18392p n=1 Tax=Lachancea thermotolerans (strain ATCC 56472 / CBS 6340 / NRRL Y-8284) TaxID=559295 RepID=C5DJQ9_LACTC|nr:KLTH0F18392p [Lachancea thermotolerans CBS 6340]CAR24548.1 KLTH0F18392p [Lachancea thermotolerans CBS 6340]
MSESSDFQDEKTVSSDINAGLRKGRRKKLACVECRQQKSKCDAHERAPESCTRCAKKNVQCVLQKDFRRTYKRVRNEVIEKRFKELTKSLSNLGAEEILRRIEEEQQTLLDQNNFTKEKLMKLRQDAASGLDKASSTLSTSSVDDTPTAEPPIESLSAEDRNRESEEAAVTIEVPTSANVFNSNIIHCSPKSLGDVYMSSEDIRDLYEEFTAKYHPFLPVVDISKGPELIYSLSPCLFWVIMLIGLRRKSKSSDIMAKLSTLVKSVLAEITISPIIRYAPSENDEPVLNVASVYSVQAFLLYTFWPPLTSSLSADTSWNTMGSAMFQAIRVGLNCAEFSTEYATTNSEQIQEQVKTWVCCNIVSQTIASSFGFPSFVSFDHTVISACELSSRQGGSYQDTYVPRSIKQMMHIAYFENQLTKTMNSNPLNAMGMVGGGEKFPLLQVLEQQLGELELRLRDSDLDDIRKFLLLVSKVHLLTYCFTGSKPSDSSAGFDAIDATVRDIETNFEVKRGFVKVYNAAIELLLHTSAMWKSDPAVIKSFPGVFVLNIWQTACIISKLVHSSLDSVLNLKLGQKVYQDAVLLTFNASVLKYDMAYRSSGIMRSIWSMFSNMHEKWKNKQAGQERRVEGDFNLDITIKSRMSASVFFDCLYILRSKCGMAKLKREMRRHSIDNDGEEELQKGPNDVGHPKGKQERRLSGNKHPEENARKLIKTIPLDPVPINAPASTGSSSASPGSQAGDVPSLRSILNRRLPRPDEARTQNSGSTFNSPQSGAGGQHTATSTEGQRANHLDLAPDALIEQSLLDPRDTSEHTSLFHRPMPVENNESIDQPILSSHRSDSPVTMEHWDNWESDMVWKDVDILMNEFAFNPTV